MALRTPRSWGEAADLFNSAFGQEYLKDWSKRERGWGLAGILDAIAQGKTPSPFGPEAVVPDLERADRRMRQEQRGVQQDVRADVQQQRGQIRRAEGGGVPGGRGLPSARGPGEAGLGRTTVPSAIRRGNPNIGRALDFDLSRTNPHAAGLLRDLQAGQGRGRAQGEGIAGGRGPRTGAADEIVGQWRSRNGSAQATERETAWGREPARATGTAPAGTTRTANPADDIVANVRRSLGEMGGASGAPDGSSLAQSLMADIMGQVSGRLGGPGTAGRADAIVSAIRAQAEANARRAAAGTGPATAVVGAGDPVFGRPGIGATPPPPPQTGDRVPFAQTTPAGGIRALAPPSTAGTGTFDPRAAFPGAERPVAQPGATTAPGAAAAAPPASGTGGTLGAPQGAIPSNLNVAFGRGGDWATVNQYDALYTQYGQQYGVDPAMLKAMAVIESGGQMIWNQNGSGAYGIMQIKPDIWGAEAAALGYDLNTPEGQIGMAGAILGGQVAATRGMTPEEAFVSVYYPTGCLDCPGEDGHTPRDYLNDMNTLMGIINGAAPAGGQVATAPGQGPLPIGANAPAGGPAFPGSDVLLPGAGGQAAPAPEGGFFGGNSTAPIDPAPLPPGSNSQEGIVQQPRWPNATGEYTVEPAADGHGVVAGPGSDEGFVEAITPGGVITADYKQQATWGPGIGEDYCYQEGHGAVCGEHAALDISCNGCQVGAPVYTPVSGRVVCGADGGADAHSSCTYAGDAAGGVGTVTIEMENGIQLIYGHMNSTTLNAGEYVEAGTQVGGMGTAGTGPHVHLEAQAWCPSMNTYVILDPTLVINGYYDTNPVC